uniref:Kazal-like domain-containing protein n=1 Tax=Graphocephala atropunctata TaxID=36148 RepID=A0A1B6MTS0_9HEMI
MWQRYGARSRLYIMKALSVCVLGGLALVGVGGQLFSATSAPNSATPLATEDHVGLYKLIRSSENAIRWMKAAVKDPLAEDELEESTTAGESGESIVFAHRTAERGFAWGPPGQNTSADAAKGNTTKSLTERVHSVLQVLYLGIRGLADRCKTLIQAGLTKVFAKKDPFLMRKYASESIEKQLDDLEKNNGSHGARDVMFACDDNMKPVCAVDVDSHYTIFQNECKMVQFNYRYGTNFSIHNKDVCMDLFASKPALFYQSPTIQPPV